MSGNTNTQDFGPSVAPGLAGDAIPGLSPQRRKPGSAKTLMAVAAMALTLVAAIGFLTMRLLGSRDQPTQEKVPDVAAAGADKLRIGDPKSATVPAPAAPAASAALPKPTTAPVAVPAIKPGADEPIPVIPNQPGQRAAAGTAGTTSPGGTPMRTMVDPIDAPLFAGQQRQAAGASRTGIKPSADDDETRDQFDRSIADLRERKKQLEGMLAAHTAQTVPGAGVAAPPVLPGMTGFAPLPPSFNATAPLPGTTGRAPGAMGGTGGTGGTGDGSGALRARAQHLAERTLTIPKGTLFSCALKTRVITATSGLVGCQVQRDVYGHDGKVVLVERGSHLDGEYQMVGVKPGLTRIPVIWTRILTPHGVSVPLESPATGSLGESGLGGHVDNRWPERIGAAILLSLIDDAIKYAANAQSGNGDQIYLSSTTDQSSKLAQEVLKTTINIPPLLYANQGGVVGVYTARDLDFSGVYRLVPTPQ